MSLIAHFTDYIVNKKDLRDYIELRKTLHERGEFNNQKLLKIQENLERLGKEEPEVLETMYRTLAQIIQEDRGHYVEYPINFAREILRIYDSGNTPQKVCDDYKKTLRHDYQTVN